MINQSSSSPSPAFLYDYGGRGWPVVPASVSSSGVSPPPPRHCVDCYASVSPPPPLREWLSMEQQSGSRKSEEERSSKSIQTSCAGTEPYYRVPILQRGISPAPGYSSALYSVQVMTQSEVDTMKSQQRSSCQVLQSFPFLQRTEFTFTLV